MSDYEVPKFVQSSDAALTGTTTGTTRPCQLESCRGIRVGVRWPGGKLTWPCSRGLVSTDVPDTMRIG